MKKIFLKLFFLIIISLILFTNISTATTNLSFDKKIGMNGFVDCNFENLKAGGVLREYHNFGWTYNYSTGKCYFKSSWFNFDEFYKKVSDAGIEILPCIQQGIDQNNRENKPVENGADTTDAQSYKIHSNVLFNYAARYGHTQVDSKKLNLDNGVEAKSGLGYITYYENWNEPDKTWHGEKAHFSPEEFAAMCSADYDGHEGALGDTYGIKQADPNAKLVYGGLAGGSAGVDYLERMKQWTEENRPSKTLPFDAINFHLYAGTNSPEASDFVESTKKLIQWRNQNAPDLEIWITEFGWDTNTASPRSAPSHDTQRDWIIREYLIADRIGIDRATVFNGRDDGDSTSTTQYATSGLTTKKGQEERKSSWYGVNTAKTTLSGFKFSSAIKEDADLYIYKYSNNSTNEECYVLWSPTQNGSIKNNYELEVGNISDANLIELKDKEETGIKTDLTVTDEKVKVNVSESPIFVKVKNNQEDNNNTSNNVPNENTDNSNNSASNKNNENTKNNSNNSNINKDEKNSSDNTNISTKNNTNNLDINKNTTTDSSNTNNTKSIKKVDSSEANKKIPYTGSTHIIFCGIIIFSLTSIIFAVKSKRF